MTTTIQLSEDNVWEITVDDTGCTIKDDAGEIIHRSATWDMTAVHLAMQLHRERVLRGKK